MTVIMGQHGPEATHGCGRYTDTELRYVARQEGLNEAFAPGKTVCVAVGQKETGKSAPEPDYIGSIGSRFAKTETGKLDEFNTTGKGLGGTLDQVGQCIQQNQKLGFVFRAVGQHTQNAEKLGHFLDFVNYHEILQ